MNYRSRMGINIIHAGNTTVMQHVVEPSGRKISIDCDLTGAVPCALVYDSEVKTPTTKSPYVMMKLEILPSCPKRVRMAAIQGLMRGYCGAIYKKRRLHHNRAARAGEPDAAAKEWMDFLTHFNFMLEEVGIKALPLNYLRPLLEVFETAVEKTVKAIDAAEKAEACAAAAAAKAAETTKAAEAGKEAK